MCFVERAVRIKQIQVLSSHTRTMPLSLAEVKTSLTGSYWGRDKGVVKQNKTTCFLYCCAIRCLQGVKSLCKGQIRQCDGRGREGSSSLNANKKRTGKE